MEYKVFRVLKDSKTVHKCDDCGSEITDFRFEVLLPNEKRKYSTICPSCAFNAYEKEFNRQQGSLKTKIKNMLTKR